LAAATLGAPLARSRDPKAVYLLHDRQPAAPVAVVKATRAIHTAADPLVDAIDGLELLANAADPFASGTWTPLSLWRI
jgi:hypothetical protein